MSANVLAHDDGAGAGCRCPLAVTASVNPKNIVECVLIKRKAELLGALDVKSLSAVFQTSKYARGARRRRVDLAPGVRCSKSGAARGAGRRPRRQTEEQDRGPLIPAPFGRGGGGGGGAMDIDDVQRMMTGGRGARARDDERRRRRSPGRTGGLTTVDEALGGKSATAAAKKALMRAEDVTEEALGEDPGDAHVLLSVTTNAFAGIPSANEAAM